MLILLSDGAGLTSRQAATVLARAGHQVEALSPGGLCLGLMTRHVRRVHDVPPVGRDPFGWLDAALEVAARRGADLLLPVQEQVAVMALARDRIEAAGLAPRCRPSGRWRRCRTRCRPAARWPGSGCRSRPR